MGFDIAHITHQTFDFIVVPVHAIFEFKTEQEKNAFVSELQERASKAGISGTVVPVWDSGNGRMGFLAPPHYHAFFKSVDLGYVAENINGEIG
jgi:hypothetical protein